MSEQNFWRKCANCKKDIPFSGIYQKCSVSTCRKSVYCNVDCWNIHVPVMNHKSAWAEEERAPTKESFLAQNESSSEARPPRRIIVSSSNTQKSATNSNTNIPKDILIVASKLKAYVKAKHDMNTSGNVLEALSEIVRIEVDKAISAAREDGRKTLMDRDF